MSCPVATRARYRGAMIVALAVLGFVAMLVWTIIGVAREASSQIGALRRVSLRYGVKLSTPNVRAGRLSREVIVFDHIASSSPMASAGVKEGDVLVQPRLLGEFARLLNKPSGAVIHFVVADGGDGNPIEQRVQRRIRAVAP